jgi:glycosyltransferase involved in cell wall biosynthesis
MLVRFASPSRISGAVKWLLEHPEVAERMARAARRQVERDYGWDATVSSTDRLYGRAGCIA